jgi:hypothetical protein
MKVKFFLLSFLFLITFVSAENKSFTEVEFNILGCSNGLAVGTCSADGEFYCHDNGTLYNTGESGFACNYCCPLGTYCTSDGCRQFLVDCSAIEDPSQCQSQGCFWIGGSCEYNPYEYGCRVYSTPSSCNNDEFGLGQRGVGTEGCEKGFYIDSCHQNISFVVDNCACEWNAGRCELVREVKEEIYSINPIEYKCREYLDVGECENYVRTIGVTAILDDIWGNFNNESCLVAEIPCDNRTYTVSCGRPFLQLPGFSLFALTVSLLLILGFYLRKKN